METTKKEAARRLRVLLIYNRMIPSIRLCGYSQLEELRRQDVLEFQAVRYISIRKQDLGWADVVIFGRSDSWYECALARQARKAGKYIGYIIDDDLLAVPMHLASAAYLNRKDIRANIQRMLSLSDILISPSPILLAKYAPEGSGRRGILTEEPAIAPVAYAPHDPAQPVRIGFAGSIDRSQDIELILKDALLKVKTEYGNRVQFAFYGAIPSFAPELEAQTIAYCDSYEAYRETLNGLGWDIGLAPMPQTPFHACKHYNKFIEYAASGIVGIYSETEPYIRLKQWENAGLFCENTSQSWYRAIKDLLENRDRLEQMRSRVCGYAWNELSIQTIAGDFYRELADCTSRTEKNSGGFYMLLPYKIIHFFIRGFSFLMSHRKDLIPAILAKLRRG